MGIQYYSPDEIRKNKPIIKEKFSHSEANNYFIRTDKVFEIVKKYLVPSKRLVDVGVGSGFLSHKLREEGYRDISLVDIDDYLAYEELGRIDILDVCFEKLPYEDKSKDAVLAIAIIEHLENPYFFIREAERVLNDGGIFIIAIPNVLSIKARWGFFVNGNLIGYHKNNNHITYFTKDVFDKVFLSKFKIVEQIYSPGYVKLLGKYKLKFKGFGKFFGNKTLIVMKKNER